MKRYISNLFAGLILVGLILPATSFAQSADEVFRAAGSPHDPKVNISFNRYYTAEGIAEITDKIAKAYWKVI